LTRPIAARDSAKAFELGFFPLPGAPSHVLIYQAASMDHTVEGTVWRYYGLLVVTGQRARRKSARTAKRMRAPRALRIHERAGMAPALSRIAPRWRNRCLALWKSRKESGYSYTLRVNLLLAQMMRCTKAISLA